MADNPIPIDFERMLAARGGHAGLLGVRFQAKGPDWIELALPYDEKLIGQEDSGVLASGPILALMDMATAFSIWVKQGGFQPQATLDLRIDYLRPAKPGRTVIGHGECYRITRAVGFTRGVAHDGDPDDPIAHVAATFMFTEAQP